MNVYLRVQDRREGRVRWVPFVGTEMTLGREPNNDLVLLHSTVARRHCVITNNDNQFRYQQLHRPRNGRSHDAPIETQEWNPLPIWEPHNETDPLLIGEFAIALEHHASDDIGSLEQVRRFLLSSTEYTASQRLEAALSFAPLPWSLLHHFAVDCAERSLLREECAGREPSQRCWEALHVKRRWIEQKASEHERNAAQLAVEREVFYCFEEDIYTKEHARYAATAAVAAASHHGAVFGVEANAANWAMDAAAAAITARASQSSHMLRHELHQRWKQAQEEEALWQCQQLARRLAMTQRARSQLFGVLLQRKQRQNRHVQQWHLHLEEALF